MTQSDRPIRLHTPLPCWHESLLSARTDIVVALAADGAFVATSRPLPAGTLVFLELEPSNRPGGIDAIVIADREGFADEHEDGFAVRFVHVDKEAADLIDDTLLGERRRAEIADAAMSLGLRIGTPTSTFVRPVGTEFPPRTTPGPGSIRGPGEIAFAEPPPAAHGEDDNGPSPFDATQPAAPLSPQAEPTPAGPGSDDTIGFHGDGDVPPTPPDFDHQHRMPTDEMYAAVPLEAVPLEEAQPQARGGPGAADDGFAEAKRTDNFAEPLEETVRFMKAATPTPPQRPRVRHDGGVETTLPFLNAPAHRGHGGDVIESTVPFLPTPAPVVTQVVTQDPGADEWAVASAPAPGPDDEPAVQAAVSVPSVGGPERLHEPMRPDDDVSAPATGEAPGAELFRAMTPAMIAPEALEGLPWAPAPQATVDISSAPQPQETKDTTQRWPMARVRHEEPSTTDSPTQTPAWAATPAHRLPTPMALASTPMAMRALTPLPFAAQTPPTPSPFERAPQLPPPPVMDADSATAGEVDFSAIFEEPPPPEPLEPDPSPESTPAVVDVDFSEFTDVLGERSPTPRARLKPLVEASAAAPALLGEKTPHPLSVPRPDPGADPRVDFRPATVLPHRAKAEADDWAVWAGAEPTGAEPTPATAQPKAAAPELEDLWNAPDPEGLEPLTLDQEASQEGPPAVAAASMETWFVGTSTAPGDDPWQPDLPPPGKPKP